MANFLEKLRELRCETRTVVEWRVSGTDEHTRRHRGSHKRFCRGRGIRNLLPFCECSSDRGRKRAPSSMCAYCVELCCLVSTKCTSIKENVARFSVEMSTFNNHVAWTERFDAPRGSVGAVRR